MIKTIKANVCFFSGSHHQFWYDALTTEISGLFHFGDCFSEAMVMFERKMRPDSLRHKLSIR
jgi:hypothetical protein